MQPNLRKAANAAFIVALATLCITSVLAWGYLETRVNAQKNEVRNAGQLYGMRIVHRFHENVGPVYMLAAAIKQNPGGFSSFDVIAEDLIRMFPMVRAIELAPGGVVRSIYPLKGNEQVLGHDLLKDRDRNKEAHQALVKRQLVVAGPFDLLQGGVGVIARYPIFLSGNLGQNNFWGFSIVLLHVSELLDIAGLSEFERADYVYEMCRVPPDATECKVFARSDGAVLTDPVRIDIDLPGATWQLAIQPRGAWLPGAIYVAIALSVLIFSLLSGVGLFRLMSGTWPFSGTR